MYLYVCSVESLILNSYLINFWERHCLFGCLLVVFWLWCRCFKCVLLSLWCFGRKVSYNCIDSWSLPSFLFTASSTHYGHVSADSGRERMTGEEMESRCVVLDDKQDSAIYLNAENTGYFLEEHLPFFLLTLVLLNPDIPCLCKQCRSRSVGFFQLIWICIVCH